jgi:hypothetical protein
MQVIRFWGRYLLVGIDGDDQTFGLLRRGSGNRQSDGKASD